MRALWPRLAYHNSLHVAGCNTDLPCTLAMQVMLPLLLLQVLVERYGCTTYSCRVCTECSILHVLHMATHIIHHQHPYNNSEAQPQRPHLKPSSSSSMYVCVRGCYGLLVFCMSNPATHRHLRPVRCSESPPCAALTALNCPPTHAHHYKGMLLNQACRPCLKPTAAAGTWPATVRPPMHKGTSQHHAFASPILACKRPLRICLNLGAQRRSGYVRAQCQRQQRTPAGACHHSHSRSTNVRGTHQPAVPQPPLAPQQQPPRMLEWHPV